MDMQNQESSTQSVSNRSDRNLPDSNLPDNYPELLKEYLALNQKYQEAREKSDLLWSLMTGIGQRLQISAASVKAAVSSLLHDGFFWDVENSNEFLGTIENSIDRVTQMLILFVLLTRSQAEKLGLKREGHHLQEILLTMKDSLISKSGEIEIHLDIPAEGKSIFVDYAYLSMAIQFLLEAVGPAQGKNIYKMYARESSEYWILEIEGASEQSVLWINDLLCCESLTEQQKIGLSSENALQIYVAIQILSSQEISVETQITPDRRAKLKLSIPFFPEDIDPAQELLIKHR